MKREIKFRAWDKGKTEWLLGYEYPSLGGFSLFGECMLMGEWGHILNDYILNYEAHGHNEDDLVVMQYTGLKDKNGKEIYEGDICTFLNPYNKETYRRIVRYCHLLACFGLYTDMETTYEYESDWLKIKDVEVIGNIYENPELLWIG